ncbi:MBL fold metallo-hydrolase [Coraliomargarita parva]|uniref:MBL fold metallo-hydrolase n=1 Tax=Coraliomargarita parva TaxID=3014050 RepID=UPI0022B4E5B7|nr:MBL fold metallo-hydrolase [Coraliomargarita parva]
MKIRIEDNFEDVIMKASTGLGFGKQELAERAGLETGKVAALLDGEADDDALKAVAAALQLDGSSLVDMAHKKWYPATTEVDGLRQYNTPFPVPGYEEMTVNSYLIWDKASHKAIAFDTGANVDAMLADIHSSGLSLKALFITHTHRDHIAAYDTLLQACPGAIGYAPKEEPFGKAMPVSHADRLHFAGLGIEARLTHGHSPGALTYVITGLPRPVAIVGDSLFCLSQGGARENYATALENNRKQILSLPENTVLCPGHGPMTTVAEEQAHNPFFPEYK